MCYNLFIVPPPPPPGRTSPVSLSCASTHGDSTDNLGGVSGDPMDTIIQQCHGNFADNFGDDFGGVSGEELEPVDTIIQREP